MLHGWIESNVMFGQHALGSVNRMGMWANLNTLEILHGQLRLQCCSVSGRTSFVNEHCMGLSFCDLVRN